MKYKKFVENLTNNNANYNNPEQAITTANLCDTISRDINTDSQRFIYELLQNADDASCDSGFLDIYIDFLQDSIIVSHKGKPFSEVDIESISSAGDGTKSNDSNKTGFKGIGFKSIFSHSNYVEIKSNNYCFKFDKEYWDNYWNDAWSSQNKWREDRKSKGKHDLIKMPWQIIPIWAELPTNLKNHAVLNEYNVSTIIRYRKIEQLKKELDDLFSKSQIVLFLRSKKVKITINSGNKILLEKSVEGEITYLKRNGVILSQWLVKTDQFSIPDDVHEEIIADDKSPQKLKEATKTEISFAIQIDKMKLKPADKENRLIFTYLPTSINYDFPFLVNASFLTDAGRQHLHQDTYWNQWIFSQIPLKYFNWIAELAHVDSEYNKQFLSVLPRKLNGYNQLETHFNKGYNKAIETVAFIPNLEGDLLKLSDALFDETNISEFISKDLLLKYINEKGNNNYTKSSFIPKLWPLGLIRELGLKEFKVRDLNEFFTSTIFSDNHKLEENFNLISFLFNQSSKKGSDEDENEWEYQLRNIAFIFDENNKLQKPEHIYFPSVEFTEDFENDISIINSSVLDQINENNHIKSWLEKLGVKEPTDITFIDKTIIGDSTFINEDNALKIGRYLFKAHKKRLLTNSHYSELRYNKFLTQKGTLVYSSNCFLSDFYEPALNMEKFTEIDFFISEEYFEKEDMKSEWKEFFLKIGVKENVDWEYQTIKFEYNGEWKERLDKDYLEKVYNTSIKYSWISWEGWDKKRNGYNFSPSQFSYKGLPFIHNAIEYKFSKMYFDKVFQKEIPELSDSISVGGNTGMITRSLSFDSEDLQVFGDYSNYMKWFLNNFSIFPTLLKDCRKASEIYNNNIPLIKEIGGKYLPILDYEGIVSEEWQELVKFKDKIKLEDYLTVLSEIWQDIDLTDDEKKENKKRIQLIYEKLAELYPNLHDKDKDKLQEWADNNKLLAKDDKFYFPIELSMVTVSGFNADNLIYTGKKATDDIITIFEKWGVKIVDNITPKFSSSKTLQDSLRDKLTSIAPLIALVAVEKSKSKEEWESEFIRISDKLSKIKFYQTTEILLSYGNDNDLQERSTYAEGNNFYYVGNWYKPRVLDGLVEPLCKFLNIRYAERILIVLLSDIFSEGLKYLEEKGFDISLIPEDFGKPPYENPTPENKNRSYNQSDADIGRRGEMIVFEELKKLYSQKYKEPLVDTDNGFKISDTVEVIWRNITENTTTDHDFKVIENNKEFFIESKATVYDRNVEKIALYISQRELSLMESAEKYLLARVYNTMSDNASVEFIKMKLDDIVD